MTTISLQEYQEIQIIGIEATQGVRGGHVFQGYFYYPAATNKGIFKVPAENYTASIQEDPEELAWQIRSRGNEG